MKKISIIILLLSVFLSDVYAQGVKDEDGEVRTGFKKENLFTGGTVALGFGSGQTTFGLGPYFGYSFNKYIDAALSLNYNYISQRDFLESGDKVRQSIIGPGIFTRIFPVKFLFAHAQYEQNFIKFRYIPAANGSFLGSKKTKSVGSFLVGPGYASGRDISKSFYYISVLFDVAKNINSPYVDKEGRINPIIRAGYHIALFQGKSEYDARRSSRRRGMY